MTEQQTTPSTPNERATSFQAVQGPAQQHYSGEVLLVSAYAILWMIILAWVALVWRKERHLSARLTDLERVLDEAASSGAHK
jgi:hypothetical protein